MIFTIIKEEVLSVLSPSSNSKDICDFGYVKLPINSKNLLTCFAKL